MMYLPLGQQVLQLEPISVLLLISLRALACSVFVAIEVHKLLWSIRGRKRHAR